MCKPTFGMYFQEKFNVFKAAKIVRLCIQVVTMQGQVDKFDIKFIQIEPIVLKLN